MPWNIICRLQLLRTCLVKSIQNQYNIEGYPTIKLIKDNEVIEYDAKPDKDTLQQFLQTVLT